MTSYKKLAEEAGQELERVKVEMDNLQHRYFQLQQQIIDGSVDSLSDEEAKVVLRTFGDRAQNRDELMMLIKALAHL